MNKTKIAACLSLAAILCGCSGAGAFSDGEIISKSVEKSDDASQTYNYSDGAEQTPNSYNSFANYSTELGLGAFRSRFEQSTGKPFVFSPAVSIVNLSLLSNAASGDALSEILLAFGGELSKTDLNESCSYFVSRLKSVSLKGKKAEELDSLPNERVDFSTNLFVPSGSEVSHSFLKANADYYGGNIIRTDFSADDFSEKISATLKDSGFTAEFTANKDGSLFGISAFKAADRWLVAEDKKIVPFSESGSGFTSSDFYTSTKNAEGVIKYTEKNPLKMLFITPKSGSLEDYVREFDSTEYFNLINNMKITEKATAQIPQFSVKSSSKPSALSKILRKQSLYSLFSDKASFKDMNFSGSLKLDELYELEPSFSVTEEGFVCAAEETTARTAGGSTSDSAQKADIEFNKPFIFILADNESNLPVLMGVY